RYVVDSEGNRINVRNSSYSDFKSEILPYGVGSVTGILSYYRNDWQISLIDAAGLQDFDNIEPEPEPVVAEPTLVANFDDGKIPEGWSNIKLAGNKEWYIASFNSEFYAAMTGYKGTPPFDSWLITAPVDLDKSTKKVMSFKTQVNGYGSTTTDLSVFVMTDPDPSKTEYTEIEFTKAAAVASGYSGWVESGEIDLSEFSGIIYVGFRYTATTDENYATWCVDNIVIGKEAETGPDTPDTPAAGTIYSGLAASNTEMPADWKAENVELGGLDYVWSWKTYNNAGYLNASAFKDGSAVASTAYMVSPEIDLTGATGCTLSFEHAAKFQTTLKDLCGIVAREKGADTWTDLTIPTWPEAGSWTFVSSGNVDLSAFDGKVIEVAFRYGSSTAGADTWEIKNLTVNGKK
ncbi:MAG: choice-of-anchor J domain-containing protein, partial [Muribaculaceae bacterium]|nr:choice-of-anchor J domain-containing protein [Muribaculaceae bacterium]